jgi:hypothetical protein
MENCVFERRGVGGGQLTRATREGGAGRVPSQVEASLHPWMATWAFLSVVERAVSGLR